MVEKSTPSLDEVATRDLWKTVVLLTAVCAVLLVCPFQILGKQDWPGWLVWGCRVLAAGVIAALWHSGPWLMFREIRRRGAAGTGE